MGYSLVASASLLSRNLHRTSSIIVSHFYLTSEWLKSKKDCESFLKRCFELNGVKFISLLIPHCSSCLHMMNNGEYVSCRTGQRGLQPLWNPCFPARYSIILYLFVISAVRLSGLGCFSRFRIELRSILNLGLKSFFPAKQHILQPIPSPLAPNASRLNPFLQGKGLPR